MISEHLSTCLWFRLLEYASLTWLAMVLMTCYCPIDLCWSVWCNLYHRITHGTRWLRPKQVMMSMQSLVHAAVTWTHVFHKLVATNQQWHSNFYCFSCSKHRWRQSLKFRFYSHGICTLSCCVEENLIDWGIKTAPVQLSLVRANRLYVLSWPVLPQINNPKVRSVGFLPNLIGLASVISDSYHTLIHIIDTAY